MAAHGFDVVRLLVSWSRLEPQRGVFDDAYLARVASTVKAAARYGIYSVIDMHQDAWGKYIASPKGVHCTNGGTPAIGWDGAPKWATLTNGADTCAHGSREMSDAVETAWDSFYADRDGIMGQLVATWADVARRFATDPAVAGYDLLNEPNHGHDTNRALLGLARYYGRAISAIREAETATRGFHHVAFFEDTVFGVVGRAGLHDRHEHRVRAAQLRRLDREHPARGRVRLLRRRGPLLRRRDVDRRVRVVLRPCGEAKPRSSGSRRRPTRCSMSARRGGNGARRAATRTRSANRVVRRHRC